MDDNKFAVNDEVEWESQSNGYRPTKRGVIVAVVGKRRKPTELDKWKSLWLTHDLRFDSVINYRVGVSYLVSVAKLTGKGRRWLYWPRAEYLHKVAS